MPKPGVKIPRLDGSRQDPPPSTTPPPPSPSWTPEIGAYRMARSSDLIDRIAEDCRDLGIVGEREFALAVYIIGTSRLMDNPLGAIIQGESSSGKSFIPLEVSRLFPTDHVHIVTKMTPKSLFYTSNLSHKFVVLGERSYNADEDASSALRQFFSEGRLSQDVPEPGKDGQRITRTVTTEGPISYIETTTMDPKNIFTEDLNRVLLLCTDSSQEQTAAIKQHLSDREKEDWEEPDTQDIIARHHAFQSSLKPEKVRVPFADRVLDSIPTALVQVRRISRQILSTIKAVTLLHQHQRTRDIKGNLIATISDYEVAKSILAAPLRLSLSLPDAAERFLSILATQVGAGNMFTTTWANGLPGVPCERTLRRWLNILRDFGCVEQASPHSGQTPASWRLITKSPELTVLPILS